MIRQTDSIAIIACGGSSTRMGTDKGLLPYFGIPQRNYLYKMLLSFCKEAFMSCTTEQSQSIDNLYSHINDEEQFAGHGPVSGLLSCFAAHPGSAILFAGCDYPYTREAYEKVIKNQS